jgi:hypothetical protein
MPSRRLHRHRALRAVVSDISPTPACVAQVSSDPQVRVILTSVFRHDYDIGHAIQEIQDRNLMTANTLVIVTADHNFPHGDALEQIPGYPKSYLSRIPLAFLSGQPLPPPDGFRLLHSQLDFAPSIVHLLGWPVPDGWWGESMFDSAFMAPSISKIGRNLIVTPVKGPQRVVSLDHPNGDAEKGLVNLFFSVYTNSPSAGTVEGTGGSRDNSP